MVRSRDGRGAVEVYTRSWCGLGKALYSMIEVRSWYASGSLPVQYV